MSADLKRFIQTCLEIEEDKRFNWLEAAKDPYLKDLISESAFKDFYKIKYNNLDVSSSTIAS